MKQLTIFFAALLISFTNIAQEFEVPENYKLEKAEDYAPLEGDVIACFNWLMSTPLNQQVEKRKEANAFLLKWIMGSPNVSVELNDKLVTFMDSPELLVIYLGGWTTYALETKDYKDKVNGATAGLEAVMAFYNKNKATIGKNKNVEKFIKMKDKGTLADYIKKNS